MYSLKSSILASSHGETITILSRCTVIQISNDVILFSKGNSQGKMQKDGTLGVNRSKEDYLLQPFQNGKLLMINIPLPRDEGKGPFQNETKRIFLLID